MTVLSKAGDVAFVTGGAGADGLDRALHAALGGADDHGCVGGKDPIAEQVSAQPVGQVDVEQREVER